MAGLICLAIVGYLLIGMIYMLVLWRWLNPVQHDLGIALPIVLVWPFMAVYCPAFFWTEAWKKRQEGQ